MNTIGTSLFLIANGTWIGAIVFQSAVVAPTVFSSLEEADARLFLRSLFPRFFRLGIVCGVVMLVGLGLAGFGARSVQLLAAVTVLMLALEFVSLAMVPGINAARDAGAAGSTRFARLHRINVLLTFIVLLAGLALFVLFALLQPHG